MRERNRNRYILFRLVILVTILYSISAFGEIFSYNNQFDEQNINNLNLQNNPPNQPVGAMNQILDFVFGDLLDSVFMPRGAPTLAGASGGPYVDDQYPSGFFEGTDPSGGEMIYQYILVGSTIQLYDTIKSPHRMSGLGYHDEKLFGLEMGTGNVYMYDLNTEEWTIGPYVTVIDGLGLAVSDTHYFLMLDSGDINVYTRNPFAFVKTIDVPSQYRFDARGLAHNRFYNEFYFSYDEFSVVKIKCDDNFNIIEHSSVDLEDWADSLYGVGFSDTGHLMFIDRNDAAIAYGYDGFFVSGTIKYYSTGDPLENVILELSDGRTVTTDASGKYSFALIEGASVTITPHKDAFAFEPPQAIIDEIVKDMEVNFTGIRYGDVSGNGKVTVYDAALVLQYITGVIGFEYCPMIAGDVTANGQISANDASLIMKYVVGIAGELSLRINSTSKELKSSRSLPLGTTKGRLRPPD